MNPQEIQRYIGQRVTLQLALEAFGRPTLTCRLTSVLPAADGFVVFLEPEEGKPGTQLSCHYHHIKAIAPA